MIVVGAPACRPCVIFTSRWYTPARRQPVCPGLAASSRACPTVAYGFVSRAGVAVRAERRGDPVAGDPGQSRLSGPSGPVSFRADERHDNRRDGQELERQRAGLPSFQRLQAGMASHPTPDAPRRLRSRGRRLPTHDRWTRRAAHRRRLRRRRGGARGGAAPMRGAGETRGRGETSRLRGGRSPSEGACRSSRPVADAPTSELDPPASA